MLLSESISCEVGEAGGFGEAVAAAAGEDEFDGGFQRYFVADRDVDGLDV